MKNKENKALKVSIGFTVIFAVALLFLTVSGPWTVKFLCEYFNHENITKFMTGIVYFAVPAGWGAIYILLKLLFNINKGIVFEESNVKLLTALSWLCLYVGFLSGFATRYYIPFAIVSVSALFIGLIVRVVRNIISQAIIIKDENDLTV
ncbi:MAG TPA: hypothetical protein DCR23_04080 [Ruminococcaceae bacterium]|nr:hypothetical protein [Oscillospiraceae bacterium]